MRKHARFLFQPVRPMGKNNSFITSCNAHWKVAKQAAVDGTVLLKNDGILPLPQGSKVCLFGRGAGDFLLGGGGSGVVYTDRKITLADGLQAAANQGKIGFFSPLVDFYLQKRAEELEGFRKLVPTVSLFNSEITNPRHTPELPEELYQQAKEFGDTAIFCLTRYSSESTLYGDLSGGKGHFTMWDEEAQLLDRLCEDFSKVVVVLNVCGPVSTKEYKENSKIGAVLYPLFGGGMAGEALTDILLGAAYPSGHLQDTLADAIEDYPSTAGYHESQDYVNYTEDIFVGYRYFETFCPEKVVYPFGYGLGYTTFAITKEDAALEKNTVRLTVRVKNTGTFPGKEVVQAYLSAPQGKLGKPAKVLCAFRKTKELKPGEEAVLRLQFDIREFGSFDDLGKIEKSAFLLEQGEYIVSVGNNVRDTQQYLRFELADTLICRRCHSYMAPQKLPERLCADGTMEKLPKAEPVSHKPVGYKLRAKNPDENLSLASALATGRIDDLLATLSDEDLTELLYGHPVMSCADTNGIGLFPKQKRDPHKIPLIPTADGPAGLRILPDRELYTTYFPCASTIAQTWDPEHARKVGAAGAREVKENNIGIWLTPGMNIHRSPMCGRNFEYYSEDPLSAGLFACAAVKGIQSEKIAATVKHYFANNKEVNRKGSDSRISQRAQREIYLRPFEIVVKKAKPWALMSSYNLVNGQQIHACWEAINGVLRGEWKYDGLVMTDWWGFSHIEDEVHAGSDVKMPEMVTYTWPEASQNTDLSQMLASGALDRSAVLAAARRILLFMDHFE